MARARHIAKAPAPKIVQTILGAGFALLRVLFNVFFLPAVLRLRTWLLRWYVPFFARRDVPVFHHHGKLLLAFRARLFRSVYWYEFCRSFWELPF